MSFILNIETATKNCSVALAKDGQTIVCLEVAEEGYSHAEKLHVLIEQVLQKAGITFHDLVAIAVSQGPGSYTGLRIGVSAAKGLCYALNIPLLAIDTLQSLASQAKITEGIVIPMLDARRMEVYSAIFSADGKRLRETQAEIITDNSFADCTMPVYFVGDCAAKCKPLLQQYNFIFLENSFFPSANEMSALSFDAFQKKEFVDVAYFEPFYLKDFIVTASKK
ncbi:tRNA (adenosine(37)-N6)-threonylcarbamoyltransferase complex dimerization subunit type 1 TsaB [Flavobacterium sp. UMI-01]|uniref:tRNA (adenosine(37)-N6)-threonylcarbamoyltransferase complex dimerization subunit type 1 TsaB n=1 Tax=Flavobacterium sp. UMI-01 TaxID=1441053 RepID=UPI001C7D6F31|nr:tRNA (adenosine(37)-N6)-threonylcarbamoyltransferase complex dimerization subunit type 1 TsaB [Flavobacterium sp. UMI-01]GIZ10373.1 tRNA (adenosine(37)-N6)-threonylcarbamoyltransferase complex dimerization subunit type 1 TsaB [Flavobacterium sp. UMI-01]